MDRYWIFIFDFTLISLHVLKSLIVITDPKKLVPFSMAIEYMELIHGSSVGAITPMHGNGKKPGTKNYKETEERGTHIRVNMERSKAGTI